MSVALAPPVLVLPLVEAPLLLEGLLVVPVLLVVLSAQVLVLLSGFLFRVYCLILQNNKLADANNLSFT